MHSTPSAFADYSMPAARMRMVVPDVARGIGLLGALVAMASTTWFTAGTLTMASSFGGVRDGNFFDRFVVMVSAMMVHQRALPLFATVLGLGVGLLATSMWNRGFSLGRTKLIIVRRYAVVTAIGVLNGALMTHGGMLAVLGAGGMITALLVGIDVRLQARIVYLLVGATSFVALVTVGLILTIPSAESMFFTMGPLQATNYLDYLKESAWHFGSDVLLSPLYLTLYLPSMIIGAQWAQRGVLTNVSAHARELRIAVYIALAISVGVGLPWGLASLGIFPSPWGQVMGQLNFYLGAFTGPGILAFITLALDRIQNNVRAGGTLPGSLAALAALGKVSFSAYVASCFILLLLSQPFALGFGSGAGAGPVAVIGAGVWVSMLAAAWVWDSMELQGILEWLVRRVAYGRTQRPEHATK